MATQAIELESLLNPKDNIAIVPEAKAIRRSNNVGEVLTKISCVTTVKGTIYAKTAETKILKQIL